MKLKIEISAVLAYHPQLCANLPHLVNLTKALAERVIPAVWIHHTLKQF